MKYAHFYASKARKFVVITDSIQGIGGFSVNVQSKPEARKIAADNGAQPWNF